MLRSKAKKEEREKNARFAIYHLATGISFYTAFVAGSLISGVSNADNDVLTTVLVFSIIFLVPGCLFLKSAADKFSTLVN